MIADTNVLVRAVVQDDPAQARAAIKVLQTAEAIIIPTTSFCELVWVLRRYNFDRAAIARAVASLLQIKNVVTDRPTVEAGQRSQQAGCDFADGVIAYEGAWLGGHTFVSFDNRATRVLEDQGHPVQLLSD